MNSMLYFVVAPPTCTTTGTVVLPSLMRIWLGLRLKPLIVIFAVSSVGIALMVTKSELSSGFSATVYFRTLDWNAGDILPAETVRFFRVASAAAPVLLSDSGETAPGLSVFLSHVKMLGGSARAFASVLQFGGTILDVHQEQPAFASHFALVDKSRQFTVWLGPGDGGPGGLGGPGDGVGGAVA